MTCHDAREQFSALVDDALAPGERAALDAHLTTCADCRRELQRFRDTVALVRAVGPVRAPAGFVDRALEAARPVPWYRRLVRGLFLPWPVKLPIEAAAIVLVAVGVALVYRGAPELRQAARFDSVAPAVSRAPESTAPPAPGPGPAPERETDARRAQYRARELPRAPDQVQSSVKDQGVKGPAEMQDKPTVATPPAPAAQQSAPLSRDAEPQKTLERGETKEPRASVAERERGEYLLPPAPCPPGTRRRTARRPPRVPIRPNGRRRLSPGWRSRRRPGCRAGWPRATPTSLFAASASSARGSAPSRIVASTHPVVATSSSSRSPARLTRSSSESSRVSVDGSRARNHPSCPLRSASFFRSPADRRGPTGAELPTTSPV